jgi:hypothetical protein
MNRIRRHRLMLGTADLLIINILSIYLFVNFVAEDEILSVEELHMSVTSLPVTSSVIWRGGNCFLWEAESELMAWRSLALWERQTDMQSADFFLQRKTSWALHLSRLNLRSERNKRESVIQCDIILRSCNLTGIVIPTWPRYPLHCSKAIQ